jgi:hypothetical protein
MRSFFLFIISKPIYSSFLDNNMSAAVVLPNLNTSNTSSSRNIRRSEKFFKRFQKEIELSNSRLSISDTSTTRLNNSSETNSATSLSPNLKTYHRTKTPTAQIIQINNKTTSQNLSTPATLSTPNINNHNNFHSNNNVHNLNNRNINSNAETNLQPIKHIKLNRSSSSLSTSGLKSASSASTTIYYKSKIQIEENNLENNKKKLASEKSSQLKTINPAAVSSNNQLASSSSLLFGFKIHKPKSTLSNEDLNLKKNNNRRAESNDNNEIKPVLSKSLTNKIENAKKNLIIKKLPEVHKRSSHITLSNTNNDQIKNNKSNLYSINSKYTSLIRQKQLNKLQTVSTIIE